MLFNSYYFILIFLPLSIAVYFFFNKKNISWIVLLSFSLFFYSFYHFEYLFLILTSIFFNYFLAVRIIRSNPLKKKKIFYLGLFINLLILGYFKYTNFFLQNINTYLETNFEFQNIILPLAISFFTFQQIAFLSDILNNKIRGLSLLKYVLFITFFPQLIAGPIVRYNNIIPQFLKPKSNNFRNSNILLGILLFILGLSKKVLLADNLAVYVDDIFLLNYENVRVHALDYLLASTSYSLQLYFDFSGYCDMAMGLAKMFNINLPLNFNSPYKAFNIIDFWRRWHITLTKFLTEFVFMPLNLKSSRKAASINKVLVKGNITLYFCLMVTFIISGVWHGAGWNFIFWGLTHGIFLSFNYFWKHMKKSFRFGSIDENYFYMIFCRIFTFFCITISFIFFRATDFSSGLNFINSFIFSFYETPNFIESHLYNFDNNIIFVLLFFISIVIVNFLPNSQELSFSIAPKMNIYKKEISKFRFSVKNYLRKIIIASLIIFLLFLNLSQLININEYIYFRF